MKLIRCHGHHRRKVTRPAGFVPFRPSLLLLDFRDFHYIRELRYCRRQQLNVSSDNLKAVSQFDSRVSLPRVNQILMYSARSLPDEPEKIPGGKPPPDLYITRHICNLHAPSRGTSGLCAPNAYDLIDILAHTSTPYIRITMF